MGELFGVQRQAITMLLKNVLKDGGLEEKQCVPWNTLLQTVKY